MLTRADLNQSSLPYKALTFGLCVYIFIYAFEAPLRFVLANGHADAAIFLRDLLLILPLFAVLVQQIVRHRVQGFFWFYAFVIAFHGVIILANFHQPFPVVYGAKLFVGMLAACVGLPVFFRPGRKLLWFFAFIWGASIAGLFIDKYVTDFPWYAMHTKIGGLEVDISRDWQIGGESKRAAGFTRSSINAAFLIPLLSFTLLYNFRPLVFKAGIVAATLVALYWTTQKGGLLAYGIVIAATMAWPMAPVRRLKFALVFLACACIALPIIMPEFSMPRTEGMFSLATFYQRIEQMWPDGWTWINAHDLFPFGVGLGGIGGAQRFYAVDDATWADNLFLFMYAYFGLLALVYLGWIVLKACQLPLDSSPMGRQALAVLTFLMGYGCVLSLLEDQMATLYFGAAIGAVYRELAEHRTVRDAIDAARKQAERERLDARRDAVTAV
jgi:hypothetical protein